MAVHPQGAPIENEGAAPGDAAASPPGATAGRKLVCGLLGSSWQQAPRAADDDAEATEPPPKPAQPRPAKCWRQCMRESMYGFVCAARCTLADGREE